MIQQAQPVKQSSAPLRLMFVVPFSPRRDLDHGGRVVAQLLGRLADRHRVALVCLRHSGTPPVEPDLARRCDLVEVIELGDRRSTAARWRHRIHVLAGPITGLPSAVAPVHDRRLARACTEVERSWRPDIVQVEHDTIAYCGRRLRGAGGTAARILVAHEPGAVASQDQARWTRGRQRLAHRLDAASWRRYWARTLPAFDALVTFTDRDREAIGRDVEGPRRAVIGLVADLPDEPLSAAGHGEPSVLYIGGFSHPPNSDAALRLLRSIMPAVRQRIPGLRLEVVGAGPGPELYRAAGRDDVVTGRVPTVTPYLDQARMLVLPIRIGGGMRVKLLEALAAGKAVVASPLAAAGLDVTDGRELLLAESDAEFVDAIVALVADQGARSRIGHAAREWAIGNLSWDSRVSDYERLYRSLLAPST